MSSGHATNLQLRKQDGIITETALCRWFHFRLTGVQNQALVVNLVNAGQSSFPEAWPGYKACASYDLQNWFRVQTAWDEKAGVITMQHKSNHVRKSLPLSSLMSCVVIMPHTSTGHIPVADW